jgi:hypothetical protein
MQVSGGLGSTPITTTTTYEYNNQDQIAKIFTSFSNTSEKLTIINEYDAKGRWVKSTSTSSTSSTSHIIRYDENGNRTLVEYFDNKTNKVISYGANKYENGNLIQSISKDPLSPNDSTVTTYEYYSNLLNPRKLVDESMGGYVVTSTPSTNLVKTYIRTRLGNFPTKLEYTYTLNDKGFPTETIVTEGSETLYPIRTIITNNYQCK